MPRPIRWSGENDRYFGPFTYARERDAYRPIAVILGSGDGDEYPNCRLRLSAFGHTLILALPAILRPYREMVYAGWDAATVERLGRNWYWNTHEREYGFSVAEGYLSVRLGRQTHDSSTTQSWGWFVPWRSWRHVRRSFYGLAGEHLATVPERRAKGADLDQRRRWWDQEQALEDATPAVTFAFDDFDGERITAATRIEEREWRRGEGRWRWLSLFSRPKVDRSLCIRFSSETGRRKGSWKGGTMGHSITMLPGELHEAAFRRYCGGHAMTFVEVAA